MHFSSTDIMAKGELRHVVARVRAAFYCACYVRSLFEENGQKWLFIFSSLTGAIFETGAYGVV